MALRQHEQRAEGEPLPGIRAWRAIDGGHPPFPSDREERRWLHTTKMGPRQAGAGEVVLASKIELRRRPVAVGARGPGDEWTADPNRQCATAGRAQKLARKGTQAQRLCSGGDERHDALF